MADANASGGLWFERVYKRLHLPFWAGALLSGVGFLVAISLVSITVGDMWDSQHLGTVIISFATYGIVGFYAQVAARAARLRVEHMDEYTAPMRQGRPLNLKPLYSAGMAFLAFWVLETAIRPLYIFSGAEFLTLSQRIIISLPFIYLDLFAFTLLWVLVYSFYIIYRVGQQELSLRPFTEDRSLGLKPLGRLSLTLTGFYLVFLLSNLVANWPIIQSVPIQALLTSFSLMSFAFFFLPLIPLRNTLLKERRSLHEQICPRLTRLYAAISEQREGRVPQDVVNELIALKAMQEDIHQIYSWPFDTGIVVRLSVIVFSVTAITLSQLVSAFLPF